MIKTDDTEEDTLSSDGQLKINGQNAVAHPSTTGLRPTHMEAAGSQLLHGVHHAADGVRTDYVNSGIHLEVEWVWCWWIPCATGPIDTTELIHLAPILWFDDPS